MRNIDTKSIDVVILCGGLGRRLRSVVCNRPKPMALINERPFLDILIDFIAGFGFRRFILCIGYFGDVIKQYYQNRKSSFEIVFSEEKKPLGTGGALKNAGSLIQSSSFLLVNGDSFCQVDLRKFLGFHIDKNALVSMVLSNMDAPLGYDTVTLGDSQRITKFNTKVKRKENHFVNAGIYLFQQEALSLIPPHKKFSLEKDFFPKILNKKFYGFVIKEKFIDIGTPERYKQAKKLFCKIKIPFGSISISQKSKDLINEILDSNRISSGKFVREFEERFAKLIGTKEAVAVSSGTDAVALALATLYDFGAMRGDEIVVPALSFVSTGSAVFQAGFKPIFVDIKRETLNINPALIEKVITKKTRAIMPVHLMGKPAKMDEINKIAKIYKLYVIEDAAEAYGTIYKGKNAGTLADMAAFSLYIAHMVTSGEGGMVVTDKKEFAQILRSLRAHGRACKCEECILNIKSDYCKKRFQYGENRDIRFIFERIGFSSKMNELEAAIGLGFIDEYQEILKKRQKNLEYLMRRFKKFSPYLVTIEEEADGKIGPHAFSIVIQEKCSFTREEFADYLEKNGIETRTLFSSIPTQCPGFKFLGYTLGDFPNAEYIGTQGIHIGIHQNLGLEEMDYILCTIEKFLESYQK